MPSRLQRSRAALQSRPPLERARELPCRAASAGDFGLGAGATLNTTTGLVLAEDGSEIAIPFVEHTQPDDSLLTVFLASSLTLQGDVEFIGNRVVAIVVDGPVEIRGSINVNAQAARCASFFFSLAEESLPGTPGATLGARGGSGGASATNPRMASVLAQPFAFVPLLPGCAGVGYENPGGNIDGGRGGGALQISSSASIEFQDASVSANGLGGPAFNAPPIGLGGGSGGVLHFEAPTIRMLGTSGIYANGGGGGGCRLNAGQPGRSSLIQAPGGSCSADPNNSGSGGLGGTLVAAARFGEDGTGVGAGGGGGGSVGVIQLPR